MLSGLKDLIQISQNNKTILLPHVHRAPLFQSNVLLMFDTIKSLTLLYPSGKNGSNNNMGSILVLNIRTISWCY